MRLLFACLLLASALPAAAQKKGLESIPPGYRAVTLALPVHEVAYLEAGDRVDIISVFNGRLSEEKKEEEFAATMFQNVVVYDLDKGRGFVRLIMNPNESQYAALVSSKLVKLAVRAKGDKEMHPMEMGSLRKLFR